MILYACDQESLQRAGYKHNSVRSCRGSSGRSYTANIVDNRAILELDIGSDMGIVFLAHLKSYRIYFLEAYQNYSPWLISLYALPCLHGSEVLAPVLYVAGRLTTVVELVYMDSDLGAIQGENGIYLGLGALATSTGSPNTFGSFVG